MTTDYPAAQVTLIEAGPPQVLAMDSIAYLDSSHAGAIVCCGSHGGLSAAKFAADFPLAAVIFNDAGFGKEDAGVQGLELLAGKGIPAAAVNHSTARIGDGLDVWLNGVISAVNALAGEAGWHEGMRVRDAVAQLGRAAAPGEQAAGEAARGTQDETSHLDRSALRDPAQFKARREFTQRVRTSIWCEEPEPDNPFAAKRSLCAGYDFYGELVGGRTFTELLFLMFRCELPAPREARLLDVVLSAVLQPGPRHWATRAAMNGAIGGTSIGNCLMAGIGALQGEYLGSQYVHRAAEMFHAGLAGLSPQDPGAAEGTGGPRSAAALAERFPELPGYGLWFSQRDNRVAAVFAVLQREELAGPAVRLAAGFEEWVAREHSLWLTLPGLFAAACVDLGFSEDQAAGAFLVAGSVGLVAHAAEQRQRKWNEYPIYWDPKLYTYEGPRPPGTGEDGE